MLECIYMLYRFLKAFYNMRHDQLILFLQEIGIVQKDMKIIHELYWNQIAKCELYHFSQINIIQ